MKNNFKYSVRQALIDWCSDSGTTRNKLKYLLQETKQKEWPQYNDEYWFIDDNGFVENSIWRNDNTDVFRMKSLGIFKTNTEAKAKSKAFAIIDSLINEITI